MLALPRFFAKLTPGRASGFLTSKAHTKGRNVQVSVRIAHERDLDQAADTLADAFADYPWTRQVTPLVTGDTILL